VKQFWPALVAVSAVVTGGAAAGAVMGSGPADARAVPAATRAAPLAGSWGTARGVPDLAALNKGGNAYVNSLSCPSAGNCAAGGSYGGARAGAAHVQQAFVAVEREGRWGNAAVVPGLAALSKGGDRGPDAEVDAVSCASPGNCAAGGEYRDQHGHLQGFVVSERDGRWGTASGVPSLAVLNAGGQADVGSVSCPSAGNCAAGGEYQDRHGHQQGFTVSERDGRWGTAAEIPGLGTLNKGVGGSAAVYQISCASPGNCTAGGIYDATDDESQGFVASEQNGTWSKAIDPPGLGALNKGFGSVNSVSCFSPGNCAAVGSYSDFNGVPLGFALSQQNGTWHTAIEIPGLGALNKRNYADAGPVSCVRPGYCAAGGYYASANGNLQAFVAVDRNGTWGKATEIPGFGTLSHGFGGVGSISCASPGNCAAGGFYQGRHGNSDAFVAVQRNGTWGKAIEIPGLAALGTHQPIPGSIATGANTMSCAPAGPCTAAGNYLDRSGKSQGFIVSQTP
jgi:hypothetical protein